MVYELYGVDLQQRDSPERQPTSVCCKPVSERHATSANQCLRDTPPLVACVLQTSVCCKPVSAANEPFSLCRTVQHTANTLHHTATHRKHTASYCNKETPPTSVFCKRDTTCNTLCNTLCNPLPHTATKRHPTSIFGSRDAICNALCNTLCNTLARVYSATERHPTRVYCNRETPA